MKEKRLGKRERNGDQDGTEVWRRKEGEEKRDEDREVNIENLA